MEVTVGPIALFYSLSKTLELCYWMVLKVCFLSMWYFDVIENIANSSSRHNVNKPYSRALILIVMLKTNSRVIDLDLIIVRREARIQLWRERWFSRLYFAKCLWLSLFETEIDVPTFQKYLRTRISSLVGHWTGTKAVQKSILSFEHAHLRDSR